MASRQIVVSEHIVAIGAHGTADLLKRSFDGEWNCLFVGVGRMATPIEACTVHSHSMILAPINEHDSRIHELRWAQHLIWLWTHRLIVSETAPATTEPSQVDFEDRAVEVATVLDSLFTTVDFDPLYLGIRTMQSHQD